MKLLNKIGDKKPKLFYLIFHCLHWLTFYFAKRSNVKLEQDFYAWRERHNLFGLNEYCSFCNLWIRFPEFRANCLYRFP